MQFHLAPDELNLLADILLSKPGAPYDRLTEMALGHDLRFDAEELETIADLLAEERQTVRSSILREEDAVNRARMQAMLARLEKLQERVAEACVMI